MLVPYFCAQSSGTRPAWPVGPLDVRPKPLCLGLCCRASRAELLLACVYFISMFGKGMVGKGMVGEDEARANVARAPVASARRDVKGGQ